MKEIFLGSLFYKLKKYHKSGVFPLHMPGHKRNMPKLMKDLLFDIENVDVTEVYGTDSLHAASGILKQAQDFAAKVYVSDNCFFLVNGSSCGILAAIRATAKANRKKIIISEDAHISAYNAIELCNLEPIIIPNIKVSYKDLNLNGGVDIEKLENVIKADFENISAVFITSPTYEGIISDIEKIVELVHSYKLPLIVDEAHGAYLRFMENAGLIKKSSAVDFNADVVIQSTHKTLPAFTQTAILHVSNESNLLENVKRNLAIFETSSPSYILMSSIDLAIRFMESESKELFSLDIKNIQNLYSETKGLKHLYIVKDLEVYETDKYKLIIYAKKDNLILSGTRLQKFLREFYNIEAEMAKEDYVLLILNIFDTKKLRSHLLSSLKDLDKKIEEMTNEEFLGSFSEKSLKNIDKLIGKRAKAHIYVYPPDIPIVRYGQIITKNMVEEIKSYIMKDCNVLGLKENGIFSNKIYYLMGKSAAGKDTIYTKLCEKYPLFKNIVIYTTRPKRDNEKDGKDYHFTDLETLKEYENEGKVIEMRVYNTVYGDWYYATVADETLDLNTFTYIGIGTLESFIKLRDYFGSSKVIPFYIEVEDSVRLERAFDREKIQKEPKYDEMCRRFLADNEDFSEENLKRANIKKRYNNFDLEKCLSDIIVDIENGSRDDL